MSLTDREWSGLADLLESWWPGEWTGRRAEAYRAALDDLPASAVARALSTALDRGDRFRPSAGELRALARGASSGPPRPSADEALGLIEQAVRMVGCSVYAADFEDRHQAAVDWLAERDVILAAFAARRGLVGRGSLGVEGLHDPEHGGKVRHRLTADLTAAYDQADERTLRGLPSVDTRTLLVRRTGQRGGGMRELVESLRPAEQIDEAA